MEIIKPGTKINFIGQWKIACTLSVLMIIACAISVVFHGGLKYGVDFAGGTEILIGFEQPVDIGIVKDGLEEAGIVNASVQESKTDSLTLMQVRTGTAIDSESGILPKLAGILTGKTGVAAEVLSTDIVGPQISQDLRSQAILALFYTLLFIMVYISGRFEKKWLLSAGIAAIFMAVVYLLPRIVEGVFNLQLPITAFIFLAFIICLVVFWVLGLPYGMGAAIALVHDVIIMVGVFSILDIEFNLPILAAILTIVGYSLNDTIIIYDRIRENLAAKDKKSFTELINKSINETLSRTILTTLTTLLVVVALLSLGGGVIYYFSLALFIGITVGIYSTIYVACPFLLLWERRQMA